MQYASESQLGSFARYMVPGFGQKRVTYGCTIYMYMFFFYLAQSYS